MFQKSIARIKQSIFPIFMHKIENSIATWEAVGTGFFISNNGHFLTSYHVIDSAKDKTCKPVYVGNTPYHTTGKPIPIDIIFADTKRDIILGHIDAPGLQPVRLSYEPRNDGISVATCGYPLPELTFNSYGALELSKVRPYWQPSFIIDQFDSIKSDENESRDAIYVTRDAALNGMSGGPLFDLEGDVIGMCLATYNRRVQQFDGGQIRVDNCVAVKMSSIKDIIDQVNKDFLLTC